MSTNGRENTPETRLLQPALIAEGVSVIKNMCVHKKRNQIGMDCEICAEIVKVGGEQYRRGWNAAVKAMKMAITKLAKTPKEVVWETE